MKRILVWFLAETDAVVALGIAIVAGVLGLLDVTTTKLADNTILLTLAVLSLAVLRDRWRSMNAEHGLTAALNEVSGRLGDLSAMHTTLIQSERALREIAAVRLLTGPREVTRAHEDAREQTGRWVFKGGTGTYIRAVTLPECVRLARRDRRALAIRLEILDPVDIDACERYAVFRRSMAELTDATGETWTCDRTREEAYATILAACWHKKRYDLLEVQIGLTSTMTTFRYDMADNRLIITQDDPRIPALMIPRESFLYASFHTELDRSLAQARKVPLDLSSTVGLGDEPTPEEVRGLFDALNLPLTLPDDHVPRIIQKAIHARNPYP
ncbi:hypothetical protein GCM10023196_038660 [Actinoallomurus vinaceus]|uniref:Uncharacterized protein n=1 Tax=Actinoallomurus vinaceus TaxID=1080074 RepID=A0ABP8UDG5_9ACTN